jgi:hypothetical protein
MIGNWFNMMTGGKIYLLLSMSWYLALEFSLAGLFDPGLFQASDFISGSLGNLVYACSYVVFFGQQNTEIRTEQLNRRRYVFMAIQIFTAGLTAFVIMSLFRDGELLRVLNTDSKASSHRWGVLIGLFYSFIIRPSFFEGVFDKILSFFKLKKADGDV